MAYTLKQLTMAWTAVHGTEPDGETASTLQLMTNPSFGDKDVLSYILNSADGATALAVLSYQFFTGKSPTKDGLAYLVGSSANPNDLGDAYYAKFDLENRYINFAANLGVQGEGAAAFASKYGALSFADYIASIYEAIIGETYAKAAGVDAAKAIADIVSRQDAILATARSAGMITAGMSPAQIDLALKAAAAGYLMGEAIKADVGLYAASANNFVLGLVKGDAVYNTDITTTYKPAEGSGSSGTGNPVDTLPPTLPGAPLPPPPLPEPEPEPDPVPAPVSMAFTLTTGVDTFTGAGAADSFTATIGTGATLNTGDTLDGAGGADTLTLTNAGATTFAIAGPTISNVEQLLVTSTTADLTVDMTGATGITEVRNVGSNRFVTFSGLTNTSTVLGVSGSVNATFFTFTDAALAGNADAVTLSLNGATVAASTNLTATTAVANQFETLNIISNGTSNSTKLATSASQTSLSTINISGAAPLTLTFNTSTEAARTVATIDASAATGNVTLGSTSVSLGAADQTIKLGSGADIVYFGGNLTSADTVDGGAGYDVLSVNAAITNAAVLTNVSNIEAIRFDVGVSTFTQNASLLAGHGFVEYQINRAGLSSATISGLVSGAKISLLATQPGATLNLQLASGSGVSDALTLNLASAGATSLGILTSVSGLETLNIVSNGGSGTNTITTSAISVKQVITGARPLTMTMSGSVAGDIDASAFTAKLTISGAVSNAQNDTVVLGTGDDVVNMRTGTDTIYIGPANDASHVYRGADVIAAATTGGATTIVFTDNSETVGGGASTSLAGVVKVGSNTSGVGNVANLTLTFSGGDDHYSVKGAHGLSKGATLAGLAAGDTIVTQSVSQNDASAAASANVSMIQLTTATAFTTDIKSTFAAAMGTASITGLAADGVYLVSLYDSTNTRTLLGLVHVGASGAGDTTLSAADFTDTGVVLIGNIASSAFMTGIVLGTVI